MVAEERKSVAEATGAGAGARGEAPCARGAATTAAAATTAPMTACVPARERLGIVGGLGPAATARLVARITDFTQVERDQDHLEIAMISCPQIPDRTNYLLGKPGAPSFVEPMQEVALQLERMGCSVLATPCNTAHARLSDIAQVLDHARFVHMPNEAAAVAVGAGCECVGVLATDGTVATGVYEAALQRAGAGVALPDPDDQRTVMDIIYNQVKAGKTVDSAALLRVCEHLVDAGADGLILGCTELSLAGIGVRAAGVPVVDAMDALAWRCVVTCGAPAFDLPGTIARG